MRLKLAFHIPEYLPMWGKKARIYYHGIPLYCVSCNEIGHVKNECQADPVSWKSYIQRLVKDGISTELFGAWINSNLTSSRVSQYDVPRPQFRREDNADEEGDERPPFDLSNLPPQMIQFFKQFGQNHSTPISSKKPNSNTTKQSSKNSQNQNRNRGRGRGRGNRGNSSNRGRGSGRGQNN